MKNNIFDTLDDDWKIFLCDLLKEKEIIDLGIRLNDVYEDDEILPKKQEVLNCFKYTRVKDLKIIILGQDPYHGKNQANGLAFSVNNGIAIPPSLRNIFIELNIEYGYNIVNTDLCPWAEQGVLLLNTILTVKKHQPLYHKNFGYDIFINSLIRYISDKKDHVVFLLWGSNARYYEKFIDTKKHLVLKTVHPSPLSAYRGFFRCNHFILANEFLLKMGLEQVNWNI